MAGYSHPLYGVVDVETDANGNVTSATGSDGSDLTQIFQQFDNYQFAYCTPLAAEPAPTVESAPPDSSPTPVEESNSITTVVSEPVSVPPAPTAPPAGDWTWNGSQWVWTVTG